MNAEPWSWFVPDFVTALTSAPAKSPYRTSYGASRTWYSCTASSGTDFAPVDGVATPVLVVRSDAPLIRKLLKRKPTPPAENPAFGTPILVEICGTRGTKS